MYSISRREKFNILASFSLSTDDMRTLALLYQPIIGREAFSLYITLSSLLSKNELDSSSYTHSFLLDLLNISEGDFVEKRRILEAIGLLVTYKNDDEYLYLLAAPMTPKSFLRDGAIGLYLYSQVGEDIFNEIKDHFKIKRINKNNYKNISASIDDVFESSIPGISPKADDNYVIDKKANKSVRFEKYDFDIDAFIRDIDTSLLAAGVTEKFKTDIINTAAIYGFDEGDMCSLFAESLGNDGMYSYNTLKKKAKVLYTFKNSEELPSLKIKQEASNDEYLHEIESLSSEDFLKSVLQSEFNRNALDIMLELNNTLPFNPTVIRIMIMYVVKMLRDKEKCDVEMPKVSYFKKVSDDWVLNGVSDTYDAYNRYILHIKEDKKVSSYKKPTKVVKPKAYSEENKKTNGMDMMEGL